VYLVACDRGDVGSTDTDCWDTVRNEPDDNLLAALRSAGDRLEGQNPRLQDLLVPGLNLRPDPEPGLIRALLNALAASIAEDEPGGMEFFHEAEARLHSIDRFAGEHSTPDAIAYLLVRLVQPLGDVVVDPAVGLGGLLLMAATVPEEPPTKLCGYDIDRDALRYARAWMYVYGVEAELELRNALASGANEDTWSLLEHGDRLSADAVLLDAPSSLTHWGDAEAYAEGRWRWGAPPPANADMAWPQIALSLLAPTGRAAIVLPAGANFRGGREGAIRERLVRDGLVEAVIHLPSRLRRDTSIPLTVWLLRRTPERFDDPVLLVDAAGLGTPGRTQHDFDEAAIDRVVELVHRWREQRQIDEHDAALAVAVPSSELEDGATLVPDLYRKLTLDVDVVALIEEYIALDAQLAPHVVIPVPDGEPLQAGAVERVPLRDLAQLVRGGTRTRPTDDDSNDRTPVLEARTLADPTRPPRYISVEDARESALVEEGDLVISLIGERPTNMTVSPEWVGAALGNNCVALRAPDARVGSGWLAAWVDTPDFEAQYAARTRGTTIARLSARDLGELSVPVPSGDVQRLAHRLGIFASGIAQAEKTAQRLRRMRQIEALIAIAETEEPA
jgi:SAM-dependent methyltransferase